jgi:hypothetical protein
VEYKNKKIGDYTVDAGVYEGAKFMWIGVSGVEGPVCERIVDMDWKMPSEFTVNEKEAVAASCKEEGNTLTFDFSATLNDGVMSEDGKETQCLASDKVRKSYNIGICCEESTTDLFCPDENPPVCQNASASCSVTDEESCVGEWKCATDRTDNCICIGENEKGNCNWEDCIRCPKDQDLYLPSRWGTGICVDKSAGESGNCNGNSCTKCFNNETLEMPLEEGKGLCLDRNFEGSVECGHFYCQKCEIGEGSALVASSGVLGICVNEAVGEGGDCGETECKKWNAAAGETGGCDSYECIKCTKDEGVADCSEGYCTCLDCSNVKSKGCCDAIKGTWQCAEMNESECICVDKNAGEKGACFIDKCVKCNSDEELKTPIYGGYSVCVNSEEIYDCSYVSCAKCTKSEIEAGKTVFCEDEYYGNCDCQ